jgi:flagellar biosynthesis protein FlhF
VKLVAFQAKDANTALSRIHAELGPDAVVISVRRLPPDGIARLWQRYGKLEVTAGVPLEPEATKEIPASDSVPPPPQNPLRNENARLPFTNRTAFEATPAQTVSRATAGRWRCIAWLEAKGLLPAFVEQLEEKIYRLHGSEPLATAEAEWSAVTNLIICHWREARQIMSGTGRPHVFIGPAGSGKTTALCKWMASAVLLNEQRVGVWRLDGETANAAEALTLHCESLGVPVERFWNAPAEAPDLLFVDLPGVETHNAEALAALREQVARLPQPHVHLVLNASVENTILFEQFEAFKEFAPEDIIFTHVDEERRRVKLWNFVFGTNCPISFLSTGQKIPGGFQRAEPALLFPQKNAHKQRVL